MEHAPGVGKWEGVVRLKASELAMALGYHAHRSPWQYLRRAVLHDDRQESEPCVSGTLDLATNPSTPNNWWHPSQVEVRKLAAEFPVQDPAFSQVLDEARRSRVEGQEPRQALETLSGMLADCDSVDDRIKNAVLECASNEISCAWGRRMEKSTASSYAERFLSAKERADLAGDAFDRPIALQRVVFSADFDFVDSRCGRGGGVSLELRGHPDGVVKSSDLVLEFKSRARPPKGCPWWTSPPVYDAVQCVAYKWLWNRTSDGGRKARVLLVERRPSSSAVGKTEDQGFELVGFEPVTPELERRVYRRCVAFLKLVALSKRCPGFFASIERLTPQARDARLRQILSDSETNDESAHESKRARS